MIQLTYIWHDCFVLETADATVVFDYYRDNDEARSPDCPKFLDNIRSDVPLYILVSHHHKDHFTRQIFKWKHKAVNVRFLLSRDTEKSVRHLLRPNSMYNGVKPDAEQVIVLRPGESFKDDIISVEAFGSTDIGNSYVVKISGKVVFHSGDLNAWVWKDESTKAEVDAEIRKYEMILNDISEALTDDKIDLAMFPVDSRIGTDYWEGAKIFTRRFDVDVFVPMHFCLADNASQYIERMADACRFSEYANPNRGMYVALQTPYSSIALPDK